MEMSIKTMMIVVLGMIALIILLAIFTVGQGQTGSMIDGIFDWFRMIGGGAT